MILFCVLLFFLIIWIIYKEWILSKIIEKRKKEEEDKVNEERRRQEMYRLEILSEIDEIKKKTYYFSRCHGNLERLISKYTFKSYDKDIIVDLLNIDGTWIKYLDNENEEYVKIALKSSINAYEYISEKYKQDIIFLANNYVSEHYKELKYYLPAKDVYNLIMNQFLDNIIKKVELKKKRNKDFYDKYLKILTWFCENFDSEKSEIARKELIESEITNKEKIKGTGSKDELEYETGKDGDLKPIRRIKYGDVFGSNDIISPDGDSIK